MDIRSTQNREEFVTIRRIDRIYTCSTNSHYVQTTNSRYTNDKATSSCYIVRLPEVSSAQLYTELVVTVIHILVCILCVYVHIFCFQIHCCSVIYNV